jgi:ATP-dependent DNA helicase PIF1
MVPAQLELRVGAQVMLVKNYDSLLVNGCVGIVIQFMLPSHHEGLSVGKATIRPLLGPEKYPLVRFSLLGDKGAPFSKEVLVLSDTFKLELPVIGVQASRRQVWTLSSHPRSTPNPTMQLPLILSWAMSIHKSQGQTLGRVRVDLKGIFQKGRDIPHLPLKASRVIHLP